MRTACHIVAKSSLFAAISIYFVIFASTASNACHHKPFRKRRKRAQRLKCFDGLFADKPNPPNAADKSANEGNWQIEEGKSPTDGSPLIVAANLVADTVLILRCKDQTPKRRFQRSTITSEVGLLT